jgi:hypothetical protein
MTIVANLPGGDTIMGTTGNGHVALRELHAIQGRLSALERQVSVLLQVPAARIVTPPRPIVAKAKAEARPAADPAEAVDVERKRDRERIRKLTADVATLSRRNRDLLLDMEKAKQQLAYREAEVNRSNSFNSGIRSERDQLQLDIARQIDVATEAKRRWVVVFTLHMDLVKECKAVLNEAKSSINAKGYIVLSPATLQGIGVVLDRSEYDLVEIVNALKIK